MTFVNAPQRVATSFLVLVATLACGSGSAQAAAAVEPAPAWSVQSATEPTSFSASHNAICESTGEHTCDQYTLVVTNVGSKASSGLVTVLDTLPQGVTVTRTPTASSEEAEAFACVTESVGGHAVVRCSSEREIPAATPAVAAITIPVVVSGEAAGTLTSRVEVFGGGARSSAFAESATPIDALATPFEVGEFQTGTLDAGGGVDTEAGDHPAALTTSFAFPSALQIPVAVGNPLSPYPIEDVKQIVTDLPPGLVGDALATPTCPLSDVAYITRKVRNGCPVDTQIGTLALATPEPAEEPSTNLRIYNVTPEHGYPAEFAVYLPAVGHAALLYASLVGSGADAHVRVTSAPQNTVVSLWGVSLTFFGDPAVHDGTQSSPKAFFTNPSDCEASGFTSTIYVDTWEHPGKIEADGEPDLNEPNWKQASSTAPPVTGCEDLQFHPTFTLAPTSTAPDAPSGVDAELRIPQSEDPNGLATPPLKDATVTLPEGFVVSPSSAGGLEGCTSEEIDLALDKPGSCPAGSQIGEVTVHTPLLEEPLTGQVFLGTPECDPCGAADAQSGRMVRAFIQVTSERYGVTLKVPGNVSLDPTTGQVTATFDNSPQQPFSSLEFKFKEGPRAPLATPSVCGTYDTTSSLVAWSTPYTQTVNGSSAFTISGCTGNPFTPSFTGGTLSNQAGAYSPLQLTFSRGDREQDFDDVEQTLPPGLLAKLAGVQRCGEAELAAAKAQTGECPAGSLLGSVTVGAGPGTDPFYTTGKIYLTGAYNGGPFGEAVVVPAVAGPFNLGNVVVRGSIRVNPVTAQASVVSDPFPTILDGIPLQVRTVNVDVDRPDFTLNPTSCDAMALGGTLVSTQGARAAVSSPFQAAGCASLGFKPVLTASTQGKASKAGGASLEVKVTYPAPFTDYANIGSVKVDLPKQLPSRLTTLQKACLAATFEANPASCPAASDVGTATATTPLLASPVSGPAYLVSHGGEAFPDFEIVLQGEGVTVILDFNTQIKNGITSLTLKRAPDVPVSSFEVKSPTGKYSALSANVPEKDDYSLCGQTLNMPTEITAQNGAVIKQTTRIGITGCPPTRPTVKKAKAATRKTKAKKSSAGRGEGRQG
jgi:uncharacterized repeat protein (TIGR01451 family)